MELIRSQYCSEEEKEDDEEEEDKEEEHLTQNMKEFVQRNALVCVYWFSC